MSNDARFQAWLVDEEAAEALVPKIGKLYRDHGVVLTLQGQSLVQLPPHAILRAHRRAHHKNGHDFAATASVAAVDALLALDLAPVEIDLGKLLLAAGSSEPAVVAAAVTSAASTLHRRGASRGGRDIVLYGFGRIGRLLARMLVTKSAGGDKYRLRAIVVRKQADDDLERRANLLRRDSVHGPFRGVVRCHPDQSALEVNGEWIHVINAPGPDQIDYAAYGIEDAIVIDNTGAWRDREARQAPVVEGRRQGHPDRARQGRHPEHRPRRQPAHDPAGRADPVRSELHHQRHRARAQGHRRPLRCSPGPHRDGSRVYKRPKPD